MDRGVKIAIFVASVAALCLGLIWDQVLSHARVIVEAQADDPLAGEIMDANIGAPNIGRLNPPEDLSPQFTLEPVGEAPAEPEHVVEAPVTFSEYTVVDNDSWWSLTHRKFAGRKLKDGDLQAANPDVESLRAGIVLRIPMRSGDANAAAQTKSDSSAASSAGDSEWAEYKVQDGDNWWTIANRIFKSRGHGSPALQRANPEVKELRAGQTLKIPPKGWAG